MEMPPVDAAALFDRLASAPFVIEAPSAPTDVRTGVIAAMAKRSSERHARPTLPERPGSKVDADLYRVAMTDVREQVDREINQEGSYRIEFVDLTTSDLNKEIARLSSMTSQAKAWQKDVKNKKFEGGVSHNLAKKGGGRMCFVSPFHPKLDIDNMLAGMVGVQIDRGDMTAVDFHTQVTWHEVGHCLLGASEMKADIFAALMTVRSSKNRDMLQRWAMWRESGELQNQEIFDDHDTSKGLWPIVRMQDELRANPEFMSLDINGLAALANTMGDRYGFTTDETLLLRETRIALLAISQKKVHYLPEEKGLRPVSFVEWMHGHQDLKPFARLFDLTRALHEGSDPGDPPALDRAAFRKALQKLAKAGDPTAKTALAAIAELSKVAPTVLKQAHAHAVMYDRNIPLKFQNGKEIAQKLIDYNATCQTISFSKDQSSFAVRDAENGRVVSAGHVVTSLEGLNIELRGRWQKPAAPGLRRLVSEEASEDLRPALR
ncbi:hypothetical protein [Bosea sp. RAC05]|uniref:hypothetical protein n=1 Tax=Bosea sp. RAC05 TaxID=1842539 RepID=UPI000858A80B|nr:hypothetical protein [Bosea sp. RAC05]AOG03113.1 hypothetical protein BSY19_5061 [Bosea sp. RAC05]